MGEALVERVVGFGIGGGGPFPGAVQVAEAHLAAAEGDRGLAIERLISTHLGLAAASGFATSVGGVALLPVMVPAALGGLYIVAARMAAGIAHLRGYDVANEVVRSAVLVCLLGSAGTATLDRAGVPAGTSSTLAALRRLPGDALRDVRREVGHHLVAQAGERGILNLMKLIPLVGGPIGAAVDTVCARTIATYAASTFVAAPAGLAVIDADPS
jgi:hypothetical protein